MAEPSGNPPGPLHACRTCTLCMPAKTPLASDKIDTPAACTIPFCPYCGGFVKRMQNVSEYMLVLALCLVVFCCIVVPLSGCESSASYPHGFETSIFAFLCEKSMHHNQSPVCSDELYVSIISLHASTSTSWTRKTVW